MEEIRVPVYLMTGFLESGKSTFLKFTIEQDYFQIEDRTLLILCEEGEEEYNKAMLEKHNTVMTVIETQEEFTAGRLLELERTYHPGRVIIEYNGMWRVSEFEQIQLPDGWKLAQQMTSVDASTFQVYMNNMKSLFVEMIRNTEMVVFNRSTPDMPLAGFRRSIKAVNQRAEVVFEDENGEINDIFSEELPYDLEAEVIEILPEDYGIWYLDTMENTERYLDKTVKFVGMVLHARGFGSKVFVPGRMAMTCCADDTTFIGFVCKSPEAGKLRSGQWVEVTAVVKREFAAAYRGRGPVLYAKSVSLCEPLKEEMVYFN